MKILIFPGYFEPEQMSSSRLNHDRFEAFAKNNIKMLVYAPMPTRGISKEVRDDYKKNKKVEMLYDGMMEVHRFPMFREGKNPIVRALRYFLCIAMQLFYGLKTKDVDLMYISSTPPIQGILGGIIHKIKHIPYFYVLQDIFPDSLVGTGLAKKGGLLWKIGRCVENFTYSNASKIIVISEDFKQNIMAKGVPDSKIEVVYNWVDEDAVKAIPKESNSLYDELQLNRETFKIVYAGNLGHAQNVGILLEAAKRLKSESNIEFLIFGTGGLEQQFKDYATKENLSNVLFFPLQPMNKISQVYSLADVSFVACKPGLGKSAMPSKTWTILCTETPVLCCFDKDTDLQRIIENNKLGLFSDSTDIEQLIKNILILSNNHALCKEMGSNGRAFVLKNLTQKVGPQKYAEVALKVGAFNK